MTRPPLSATELCDFEQDLVEAELGLANEAAFQTTVSRFLGGATINDVAVLEAFRAFVVANLSSQVFRRFAVRAAAKHLGVSPERVTFYFDADELGQEGASTFH